MEHLLNKHEHPDLVEGTILINIFKTVKFSSTEGDNFDTVFELAVLSDADKMTNSEGPKSNLTGINTVYPKTKNHYTS